ncbi:MAG: M6 family metalloprotease domain-containing protein, partial [ANME-2 cluster archaeon]|nr:M6 family metalloprotease domain-containing protein [ANME-2 cluster archaeon]
MRKIITGFIIVFLLSLINCATAVPASPYPFTLEQPDGYNFQARHYGDERVQWIETLDGYSIVKEEKGWWTYAAKNKEGKLTSTNYRVGMVRPLSVMFEKHVTPDWRPDPVAITKSISGVKIETLDSKVKGMSGIATVTTEKVVVILINFTDVPQQQAHDKTYYDNLLFNNSPRANSLSNYLREVSYGQSGVTGSIENKWYKSSHSMAYYGEDVTGIDENKTRTDPNTWYIFNLAREAVQLADADIDFSQYDTNSDGVVDHVIIIHAGNAQESSYYSNDIWSHKWSIFNYYPGSGWLETGVTVDGVKVIEYAMIAEGAPLGTVAHEFFHDLGAPELYDYDNGINRNYPVGKWDLMDHGSWNNYGNTPAHLGGYLKWDIDANPDNGIQGWLTPETISIPQTLAIDNLESSTGNRLFKVDISGTNQYFLVENRQRTGYDSYLPEAGILIWHIDEDMPPNSGPPYHAYYRVWVEDPSDTSDKSGAAYSSNDGQTSFNQTTIPNSNQNDDTSTGIKIYNIGTSGSSMNVTFFNTPPSVTVTSPNGDEAISGNMTVRWVHTDIDPSDIHTITIRLSSDGGTTYPITMVSGLNDQISSYIFNTMSLPDGSNYKVQVIATDNYGMSLSGNDSSDGVFTIENTPPVLIGNPTGYPVGQTAAKNGSQLTLNATVIEYGAGVKNATVNAFQINVYYMTPLLLEKVNDYWINQSVIVNTVDGIYFLPVQAYDNALNSNTSPVIQVIVDNTPPGAVASIKYQKGNAANNDSNIILIVSATDNPGGSGIKNVTANVSAINTSDIITLTKQGNNWTGSLVVAATEGDHSVKIIVMDNASNINYSEVNVTMDNTLPTISGNTPTGIDIPVTSMITVTFNEPMNTTSVE